MAVPLSGLTTRGRCLLAAGGALAVCSVALGQRDLLRASVFLLALPLASILIVSRTRYRLACSRVLEPPRVEAGRPATVRLHLENVSRLPSGVLLMEDNLPYVLGPRPRFVLDRVAPQAVREISYPVRAEARGRYRIGPLAVRLTDPFGLSELTRSFAAVDHLVVTPAVTRLPRILLGGDWVGGGDATSRSLAVSGNDDATTREYRHGDDLRKIHWRSTARVGELMVRREENPYQGRATLLLDGRAAAHRGDGPGSSFEWSVSATASIAVALARAGYGLRLLNETGLDLVPSGVQVTEGALLDILAGVATTRTEGVNLATEQLRRTGVDGVLVAVLGQLSADDADRMSRLRQGASRCVAVLVETSAWAASSPRVRAAESADYARAAVVLESGGWRVLRVTHGTTLASVWPLAGHLGERSHVEARR